MGSLAVFFALVERTSTVFFWPESNSGGYFPHDSDGTSAGSRLAAFSGPTIRRERFPLAEREFRSIQLPQELECSEVFQDTQMR